MGCCLDAWFRVPDAGAISVADRIDINRRFSPLLKSIEENLRGHLS